jgi:hypothetical protein
MTLDTALRAVSALAQLVVLVVAVLALQTRHAGTMHVTTRQKVTVVCAAGRGPARGGSRPPRLSTAGGFDDRTEVRRS